LFQLSEADMIRIVLGPHVLKEGEEVVRRKKPASLPDLAWLLSVGCVTVSKAAGMEYLEAARKMVSYRPDARILAEAMSLRPDWFITHDKEHFLRADLRKQLPFQLGTPGDLLQYLKAQLSGG